MAGPTWQICHGSLVRNRQPRTANRTLTPLKSHKFNGSYILLRTRFFPKNCDRRQFLLDSRLSIPIQSANRDVTLWSDRVDSRKARMLFKRITRRFLHECKLLVSSRLGRRLVAVRFVAIAVVLAGTTLLPRTGQAEFVSSALPGATSFGFDTASLDSSLDILGGSTSSEQRDQSPTNNPPDDEQRQPSSVRLGACDAADCGAGNASTSAPSGGASVCLGILHGSPGCRLAVCTGIMHFEDALTPPSPPLFGLLDPPR